MDSIKISQLPEKSELTGSEMLPVQLDSNNYKIDVNSIINKSKELLHSANRYTYDELKQLADSKLLIPGHHYILTDYQCIYIQPVTEELITCDYDGWLMALIAVSESEFSKDVSVYFTDDSSYIANGGVAIKECKYIFDNFSEYTWTDTSSKGVICDLTDVLNNRCNYDFKHIKFRRWAVKDVTENDTVGTAEQAAAYRCYGTAEEPKRNDGRSWVGSGLEIEKEYIKSIFDGTFNRVMWGQAPLHDDYITKVHKSFKRTEEHLQYLAYDTSLDSISRLDQAVPGLVKFNIDELNYIDCYTFEHGGVDFSNRNLVDLIITTNNDHTLPNIVILLLSNINYDDVFSGYIFNNKINGKNITISLHDLYDGSVPYFCRVNAEDLRNTIISSFRLNQVKFPKYCTNNYISGTLNDCSFENIQNSVLFGYYSAVNCLSCTFNLLFGNDINIVNSDGTWQSPADGNYWYDCVMQDWFGYNIMAPFQYAVFYPHTNTNTVKLPYNKGVTLMGTFQDNFVERMRWGVIVLYGAVQGNYLTELTGTVIAPSAFVSLVNHSSGVSSIYKLEGAAQFPSINGCDVKLYQANLSALLSNLNVAQKNQLADRNRKILTAIGTTPVIKYYNTSSGGGNITDEVLTNYYTKKEVDELLTQVTKVFL